MNKLGNSFCAGSGAGIRQPGGGDECRLSRISGYGWPKSARSAAGGALAAPLPSSPEEMRREQMRGEAPLPPDRHHDNIRELPLKRDASGGDKPPPPKETGGGGGGGGGTPRLESRRDGGDFRDILRTRPCRRAPQSLGRRRFLLLREHPRPVDPDLSLPDFRPGSVEPQHRHFDHAHSDRRRRAAGPCGARHDPPLHADAGGGGFREPARLAGSRLGGEGGAGRLDSRVPGAARSPADPLLPHRRRAAQHPRCPGRTNLSAGDLPDPPRSRHDRRRDRHWRCSLWPDSTRD